MKTILNLLLGILGIVVIFVILCVFLGLINYDLEPETIFGGLTWAIFFIAVSLKKNKTETEIFFEQDNIDKPIWWKRFVGFVIDFSIVTIIYLILVLSLSEMFGNRIDFECGPVLIFSVLYLLYFSIQEYFFKTSIGKSVFKLKVVNTYLDKHLTFTQIVIRNLTKFFLIHINFFFFMVKKPIGLHDILSKTAVVYK